MMEHDQVQTRAWVLHPELKTDNTRRDPGPALQEAEALAKALPDLDVIGAQVVNLRKATPGLLFGKGKVEELAAQFAGQDIELVLIDGSVTPVQQRNLEKAWDVKVLDRTGLILEIFSDRARTREGVLQVEMAALSYQRTRLVRAWTHLERQRGGLGFVGGPGETQIEADRRAIDDHLVRLRRQLDKVVKTRTLHRAARAKVPYPVVALVGYTNAGKSTLFNRLTGADVMVKDMLFATLDPTMRRLQLPDGPEIILSDTVGFISDLPTELVAAFRATLEEVLGADLIVHVRDISHDDTEAQARNVESILATLGVQADFELDISPDSGPDSGFRPDVEPEPESGATTAQGRMELWNKLDLLPPDEADAARARAAREPGVCAISALTGEGLDAMLADMALALQGARFETQLHLGFAQGKARAWLFQQDIVVSETQGEDGFDITVLWSAKQEAQFKAL